MKKRSIVILAFMFLALAVIISFFLYLRFESNTDIIVIEVIDGDTFRMSDNETVRLLCIDTPEKGENGYEEAKEALTQLVLMKKVRLEGDVSERDDYGRLLRYVYVSFGADDEEIFVNREMVRSGNARVFRYGNDTKRCDEIER